MLGRRRGLVIDTRSTHAQAREIVADLRELTSAPVTVVVDTHGHFDHAFGNHVFRPATIWGHERCVTFMARTGETRRARVAAEMPELADDLAEVVIDPPDRTFSDTAVVEVGGRPVELRYLGRGHTDHDIVVLVPDAGVLFAGDLIENGAVPLYGDGYPLDWPATVAGIVRPRRWRRGIRATATTPAARSSRSRRSRSRQLRRSLGVSMAATYPSTRPSPGRRSQPIQRRTSAARSNGR